MSFNQKLYNELYTLRQRIKDEERYKYGRAPIVCSDEALFEMTNLLPKKISDFYCVPGLGQTFTDNYGNRFLNVILKYEKSPEAEVLKMSSNAAQTMKELEKKLVNINRRNRLLYMPKAANKYAFDLYDPDGLRDPLKIIFGGSKGQLICHINDISKIKGQNGIDKYRRAIQLIREVNKDRRDKGQNDLFIGYPFVQGRLAGENFDIRAPLVLFPVSEEREAQCIKIKLDDTRDIVYNNALVLAHFKFNNIARPLPNNIIEDISAETFIQEVVKFYKGNGIEITYYSDSVDKFLEYSADEFPSYRNGELHLVRNIVLGKFPTYSSSIQKDFNDILGKNEINYLLNDLIIGMDEIDYYSDSIQGEEDLKQQDKLLEISENALVYINELNSAQEAVLAATDKLNELVIQGPPGTGKSQTITSLISKYANEGKTVLMVSEKKTALDVVYSRLGDLSRYTLLIDDVGDKDSFYRQMEKISNIRSSLGEVAVDLKPISDGIDTHVSRLELIAQKLYSPDSFGIEPYKLYMMNRKIELSESDQLQKYRLIKSCITPWLLSIKFETLAQLHQKFADRLLLENLEIYKKLSEEFPWLNDIKDNLSEYEVIILNEKLEDCIQKIHEWSAKGLFARQFSKGKLMKEIRGDFSEYFTIHEKKVCLLIFNTINKIKEGLANYSSFIDKKFLYNKLSENERLYFDVMRSAYLKQFGDLTACNDELFNQILYEHIQQFEIDNRELFQTVSSFDGIILSLSQAINQKRELSRKKLEQILTENVASINTSKRSGEISRVIESRRKWSVNKFISKFDFELFKGIKIWLLTPEVVSEIIPLQVGLFNLVIFDEASQMYVEKGIPSILRAKKVVIAGDQKQLRPSNLGAGRVDIDEDLLEEDSEINAALEEESLLDLARFKYKDILLNFHYRSMYEELIAFSNYAFYKGRLYVCPNIEKPEKPPIEVHKMDGALWANRSNIKEAREVVCLLKQFLKERENDDTIGIITFNSTQRDLIDDLIDEESVKDLEFAAAVKAEINRKQNGEDIGLFVKNIESVQGDERDVIMFSIGYAKNENGRLVRNYGWLNQKAGENRLNVAISRAKKKVHIVTSFDPSELQVEDAKNDGPRLLKKYLEYAFAVSQEDKESARQILLSFGDAEDNSVVTFDSDFENQVYDALVEKGYQVDTQVGIGGYSIDLAIKREGKYILGLECDGKLYHSSKAARERDYHRQKYLMSRGWRIHRIWSTNWWKNPKAEISKICTVVDSL